MTSLIVHTLSEPISEVFYDSYQHRRGYVGNVFLDVHLQVTHGTWSVDINSGFQKPHKRNHKRPNQENGLASAMKHLKSHWLPPPDWLCWTDPPQGDNEKKNVLEFPINHS